MKTKYLLAAAAASFALLSCNKESQEGDFVGNDGMTILASIEDGTKTVVGGIDTTDQSLSLVFTSADELRVLGKNSSDQYKVARFTTEQQGRDKQKEFTCTDETFVGYTPLYAVDSDKNVEYDTEGTVTATGFVNNATLTYRWTTSYPENSTLHIGTVTDNKVSLKNVCSLLGFKVAYPNVTKIVFKAIGGEALGGKVTIDLEGNITDKTQAGVTELKLNLRKADIGNFFPINKTFFIPILPGTYSSGFSFTFYNGSTEMKTVSVNKSLTFKKGEYRNISTPLIPSDCLVVDFNMSEEWPYEEGLVAKTAQQSDVIDYYTLKGADYKIGMCCGANNNTYQWKTNAKYIDAIRVGPSSSYLDNCFFFELMPVENYQLYSVGVLDPTLDHDVYVCSGIAKSGEEKKAYKVSSFRSKENSFTTGVVSCEPGKSYYLFRWGTAPFRVKQLVLTYIPKLNQE